ncbi:hypothetical protein QWY31_10680 [Cytophagales bacterium LB-30]|uniref:Uncharacterized protein n=1 Tax=Shiella aurantiaca TaxID=3058365 RepID=A0ABT8F6V4_9BACT|nr:hypothetical protein [Shiella aurantiaca]MDN4165969.1 hypothetical protein [Shiella aurantiaca]
MKKVLVFSLALALAGIARAQELAITQSGDSVYLFADGTWEYYNEEVYANGSDLDFVEIPLNETAFEKPANAKSKVSGSDAFYEIWYNAKEWKRIPSGRINESADVVMTYQKGDIYLMTIYEKIQIPIDNLMQIAVQNAQNAASEVEVIHKEKRKVNGKEVGHMQIVGSTNGINFTYYSYYYSNEKGTVQVTTFTGQNLFEEYRPAMEALLNGLIIND